MKRVKRSYCEVPFVATVEGKPVEGRIDRLCEMDDGSWVVIDYKSEAFFEHSMDVGANTLSLSIYVEAVNKFIKKPATGLLYSTALDSFSVH